MKHLLLVDYRQFRSPSVKKSFFEEKKKFIEKLELGWDVLPYLPYSPDLASSDA